MLAVALFYSTDVPVRPSGMLHKIVDLMLPRTRLVDERELSSSALGEASDIYEHLDERAAV
jgi:hypothetical protein